jgi:Flp pilus assembly protein TadB
MVDTWNEFDNQESPGPKWNPRKSKLLAAGLALLILALVFVGIYAVSSIWFDLVIVGTGIALWYYGSRRKQKSRR